MPIKKRSASQAAKDKAALKRLQKAGTYRGKIDLRKAPTKRQSELIKELSAKRGKRSKQKMPPATPVKDAKITRKKLTAKQLSKERKSALTTYALPFLRRGRDEPEWRRFTYTQLQKFMAEYKGDDPDAAEEWMSYAVRESWVFDTPDEKTEFRSEVNLYFSGRRIDEPHGKIRKKITRKKAAKSKGARSRKRNG